MKSSSVLAFLVAVGLPGAAWAQPAEIVYENSAEYSGQYASIVREYGDEITLGGKARTVTEFIFEYAGEFISQGDEVGRIHFYANDGPFGKPQTVIWESPLFPVRSGAGFTEGWGNLNIQVPDTFTWTVQFQGLTMNTTVGQRDVAGLRYYFLPDVGLTYNDMWIKDDPNNPQGWNLYGPPAGVPKANFGSRVTAVPEPSVVALATLALAVGVISYSKRRRDGRAAD